MLPVMPDVQALLDEPFEFRKAVDDGIGLMRMPLGTRKNLVDPRVVPAGPVEEY